MTRFNCTTIKHFGMYLTSVQIRADGSIVVVQDNKHGAPDCVTIPTDLADAIIAVRTRKTKLCMGAA